MPQLPDASVLVVAVLLAGLAMAGPGWSATDELGDGTADVRVVEPVWLQQGADRAAELRTTPGRFGSAATYIRTPSLVVDVTDVTGRPELYYDLSVPALDVDPAPVTRRPTGPGRYRLPHDDVAIPPSDYDGTVEPPAAGTYTAHVVVRVRSFSGDHVVVNRTAEVVVDR